MRPSKAIAPSTTTLGIARTLYCFASAQTSFSEQRRSITSHPQAATAFFTNCSVSSHSGQPALNTSIFLLSAISIHLRRSVKDLLGFAAALIQYLTGVFAE